MSTDGKLPIKATARDLLEHIAGRSHAAHALVKKRKKVMGIVVATCSCGELVKIPASDEYITALRHVEER